MNKRQKEVELAKLKAEELELKRLKAIYTKAAEDISKKISISNGKISVLLKDIDELDDVQKSILQSQIYQKQFQEQLQKQLNGFLSELKGKQYESIDEYLKDCYKTGFIGSMYDLAGQGIPLILPIDQKAVQTAIKIDSKISKSLYTKLGEDVELLKKRISNNISRGIATADQYANIARNIAADSNKGFNRAMRIARTEGHGVQCKSAWDAQHAAKEAGADVVKQWDAAMDKRTRASHARLDGEIRELDEKFSNGMKMPSDPAGGAAEVVNCRCALLQRARWALDDDELETLKERAEYFGLDKTKDFDDFVRKYVKAADIVPLMEVAVAGGLQVYKKEEIEAMALKTSEIANKHIANESKWSGHIEINDESGKSGKLWNCDIRTMSETSPFIILHEQIHAHSISHADEDTYLKYGAIEEATVQFMAQEISKKEGIEIIESGYDDMVDSLRKLKSKLKIDKTDYDFAKELIEMPVAERLDWLEEKAYNIMQDGGTIEEYQEINELIDMLR